MSKPHSHSVKVVEFCKMTGFVQSQCLSSILRPMSDGLITLSVPRRGKIGLFNYSRQYPLTLVTYFISGSIIEINIVLGGGGVRHLCLTPFGINKVELSPVTPHPHLSLVQQMHVSTLCPAVDQRSFSHAQEQVFIVTMHRHLDFNVNQIS